MNDAVTPEIRLFADRYDSCRESLVEFRNANREIRQNLTYFDWRYRGQGTAAEPIIVWAETDRGEKVGALSLIPRWFCVNGEECLVGVLGDISVSGRWRGKRIAQQMLCYLAEHEAVKAMRMSIVLPNMEAARALAKCQWGIVVCLHRFTKPIDIAAKLDRFSFPPWLGGILARSAKLLFRTLEFGSRSSSTARYRCSEVAAIDARFDELWSSVAWRGWVAGVRNRKYLEWRYLQHPQQRYHIFIAEDKSRLCGYLVYHLWNKECFIDDALFEPSAISGVQLLSLFLEKVRTGQTVSSVSMYQGDAGVPYLPLRRLGFIRRKDYQYVMSWQSQPEDAVDSVKNFRWHVTAGDKDV